MVDTAEDTKIEELVREIDRFLGQLGERELVGSGEVVDFVLDLRLILRPN